MSGTLTSPKSRSLSPAKRDPFLTLRGQMEDLLSRFWHEGGENGWLTGELAPSIDVSETEKVVEVRVDLPGVKPNEIRVQLHQNVLTVSGERKEDKEEKNRTYHRVERRVGRFSRSVTLPCAVNADEVVANHEGGILTITLPKAEEADTRTIAVKGS